MIKLPQYTCVVCNIATEKRSQLNSHYRTNHENTSFVCTECTFSTPAKWQLDRHIKECHDKRYECGICHKLFGQKWNLIAHKKVHTDGEILHCILCTKSFLKKYDHKEHMIKEHKKNGRWVCHVCLNDERRPALFKRRFQLESHLNNKHIKKKINCTFPGCKFSAYHRYHVNSHYNGKHNFKKPNGKVNDKAEGSNEMLAGNMDKQHVLEEKIYCCNCKRAFENQTEYIQHFKGIGYLPYYSPPNTVPLDIQIPTYPRSLSPEETMVPKTMNDGFENGAQYSQYVEGVEYWPWYSPNTASLNLIPSHSRSLSAEEIMAPEITTAGYGTINGQKIPSQMEEPQRQPLDLSMSRFKHDNKLK